MVWVVMVGLVASVRSDNIVTLRPATDGTIHTDFSKLGGAGGMSGMGEEGPDGDDDDEEMPGLEEDEGEGEGEGESKGKGKEGEEATEAPKAASKIEEIP